MRADDIRTGDANTGIASAGDATRTMVVWCPDWPVTAAIRSGLVAADEPSAVFRANRVIAASASAREAGVRRTMRRREAQSRCPELVVLDDDTGRDARVYEQVACVIDTFTPRIEVVRPGLCQFPTRGPSRYFGGDAALTQAIQFALAEVGVEARVGVADGAFTAALAARRTSGDAKIEATTDTSVELLPDGVVVPPHTSAEFLAPFPIAALVAVEGGRAITRAAATSRRKQSTPKQTAKRSDADGLALIDLVDLLKRLGLYTLGAFAALPAADVSARFGPVGERAWRLAQGLDAHPPQTRTPPPDLVVQTDLDPPVDRVDTAAFVAKTMAEEFYERLQRLGLACTRVSIEAVTTDDVLLARLWRHERAGEAGGLTAQNLSDRVRWQIDGWLQQRSVADKKAFLATVPKSKHTDEQLLSEMPERLTGGLTLLRLVPDEVVPDEGRQLRLWGGASAADERAARAFARVQGLLGPESVCTAVRTGGRRPADLFSLVPWGDTRDVPPTADQPWPGHLPAPHPAIVHPLPLAADLFDAAGKSVRVSGRGELSSVPTLLQVGSDRSAKREEVVNWAGPWPLEEKWWDVQSARRQARLQVITAQKRAYLVVAEAGAWWIEGEYA